MVVDRSNYTFFWIVITWGICWYGSRQHRSNFWIKSLYKLSCDPQISCTGCDPAAIWNTDPWTHTSIMKLHRLRNRGFGGLSPSIFWVEGPEYPSAPPKSYILIKSWTNKGPNIMQIKPTKYKISLGKGALPPCHHQNRIYVYILTGKGLKLCTFVSPKYTFFYEKKGCPLVTIRKIRPKRAWNYALEKGLKLCIYGSPEIHILLWNEGLPPCNHQKN